MATAEKTVDKILVYDGDCPMCRATVGVLLRVGAVQPFQLRSNHGLSAEDLEVVRAAGIRNQLVVLETSTKATRAGVDGLLWLMRDSGKPLLARVLGLPGIRQALRAGYATISYNRRILSPPRTQIVCDCEPEVTLARRLALVVPLAVVTVAIWALAGSVTLARLVEVDGWRAAAWTALVAASGPLILAAIAAVILPRGKRIDYVGHLAVTEAAGALALLPVAIAGPWLPSAVLAALACASLAVATLVMRSVQRRRVEVRAIGRAWFWAWATCWLARLGVLAALFWSATGNY